MALIRLSPCECGEYITTDNEKDIATHNKSKRHTIYTKYKDIIINGKITCIPCNLTLNPMSYETHLESNSHKNGIRRDETFSCDCGRDIHIYVKELHLKSKAHKELLLKKEIIEEKQAYKMERYRINKDRNNCCERCFAVRIPDKYFSPTT